MWMLYVKKKLKYFKTNILNKSISRGNVLNKYIPSVNNYIVTWKYCFDVVAVTLITIMLLNFSSTELEFVWSFY